GGVRDRILDDQARHAVVEQIHKNLQIGISQVKAAEIGHGLHHHAGANFQLTEKHQAVCLHEQAAFQNPFHGLHVVQVNAMTFAANVMGNVGLIKPLHDQ